MRKYEVADVTDGWFAYHHENGREMYLIKGQNRFLSWAEVMNDGDWRKKICHKTRREAIQGLKATVTKPLILMPGRDNIFIEA